MHAYRNTRGSDSYAPYGTCRKCGWTGQDWGFKYHGYCKKCHNQWRKEKTEERRRLKPPNENIEVAEGVVITRNVRERLKKQAHYDVPRTRKMIWLAVGENAALLLSMSALLLLWFSIILSPIHTPLPLICAVIGFLFARACNRAYKGEKTQHTQIVQARLEELARERQRQIDEMKAFYVSSEWRLVRGQVIQEQGHLCQECRCRITDDYDLTVDHIKPRSLFPELALNKSNLQVLCRKCNSAKGATYNEASVTAQFTKPS